jgi:hypothetical protein
VDATPSRRPEQVCQSVNLSICQLHILFGSRCALRWESIFYRCKITSDKALCNKCKT